MRFNGLSSSNSSVLTRVKEEVSPALDSLRSSRGNHGGPSGMWLWYFVLGSVDCQRLPVSNATLACGAVGSFTCGTGECIPSGWQCDGNPDCADRSDEKSCLKSRCASSFFTCANGVHCIIGRFQCNGFRDCPDGSDEDDCTANPVLCSSSRFHCQNGRCVDRSFLCNGQDNCQDNSDEENCLATPESPGQDFVTLDYRLRYYPSITYAVIGSAVVFVLVVALLALVLHHQRKRSIYRGSCHQPLLLSRLVIVDRPIRPAGASPSLHSLHLLTTSHYPSATDRPPEYSQAVLDTGRPSWFDLPPPPYRPNGADESDPPLYEDAVQSRDEAQRPTV